METQSKRDCPKPDSTDLERRVLAHERILQSLIAYMSHSEPRFVEHLKTRFVDTMLMARREQDYRDVDDYAEEFIRAVMNLEESCAGTTSNVPKSKTVAKRPVIKRVLATTDMLPPEGKPDRVQVRERNGIWEVRVDGAFLGNYHQSEHAKTAAALARYSLK
ncbi:hypothetical protein [Roseibium aggregatum]|uniref:hypothetical protein n=1 Tax=Roseibium aggregatum TaxID=187304 RepID=UPI0025ACF6FC|nr:hypothetical protein [Roseibium aggregatum]WJS05848.1 hypothetical protein QUB73_27905 [Roseibium aggregatum]